MPPSIWSKVEVDQSLIRAGRCAREIRTLLKVFAGQGDLGIDDGGPRLSAVAGDSNPKGVKTASNWALPTAGSPKTSPRFGSRKKTASKKTIVGRVWSYGDRPAKRIGVGEEEFPRLAAVGGFVEAALVAFARGHDDCGAFVEGLDAAKVEFRGTAGTWSGSPP
jgi:hypothetical protein